MKNIKWTDETTKRALKTFLQAALAYIAMNFAGIDFTGDRDMLKTALIGLALSGISAGIAALMNLQTPTEPEQLGGTATLTFDAWVKQYLGKKTDYDGVYGVQCVDLIDCYIDKCLGLKKGFWGNAKNWWTDRNKNNWLKNNFEFITPTYKNGELKAGDIGIRTNGTYGHIFVIAEPSANGKFKYYDQNTSNNGDAMTLRTKDFTNANINGVLRPKNQTPFKTVSKPTVSNSFKKGSVYTLTVDVKVRTGAGTNCKQKTVSQLTKDGRKNAISKKVNDYAVLKAGTKFTVNELKPIDTDIWAKIPSGWICLRYNGKNYAK